ncbi:MAG: SEC-C metal-binding domain-containing protein [Bryobacteraceae bacterium]
MPPFFFAEEPAETDEHNAAHVHGPDCHHDHASEPARVKSIQAGRNEPCPCGSGKKFKKCHGAPN